MKLITPHEYSMLKDELHEYVTICNRYNFIPTRDEFQDIINFLLLFSGGDTTVCESILLDDLYEGSFQFNEDSSYDPGKDLDSIVGLAGNVAVGAAGAAALVGLGTAAWISYLFKKSKVKKSVKTELQKEMDKLKEYELLNKLIEKKAKLEGRETWNIEYPALAKSSDS
jgi:hypothetical protein